MAANGGAGQPDLRHQLQSAAPRRALVRGNGKIIQEPESFFRGAGWNVIKVVWAAEWTLLLHRRQGRRPGEPDDHRPTATSRPTAPTTAPTCASTLFWPRPRTQGVLLANISDADIWNLKPAAATTTARSHASLPAAIGAQGNSRRVILAHTNQAGIHAGRALPVAANATHQMTRLRCRTSRDFRDAIRIPITGRPARGETPPPKPVPITTRARKRRRDPLPAGPPALPGGFCPGSGATAPSRSPLPPRDLPPLISQAAQPPPMATVRCTRTAAWRSPTSAVIVTDHPRRGPALFGRLDSWSPGR